MRWCRAVLLLALVVAATSLVGWAVSGPLVEGWRVVGTTGGEPLPPRATDLTALLTGGCALLLALAWLWLAAAVGACTRDALHLGPEGVDGAGSWLLRPRVVRVLVATCLGVTAFAGPATAAPSSVGRVQAHPDDLQATAVTPGLTTLRLLDGLPVPDRVTGHALDRSRGRPPRQAPREAPRQTPREAPREAPRRAPREAPVESPPPQGTLHVEPGDSLWSLTAGLLPLGAPAAAIAAGWRLLYAANREVVGDDPDLLQPGQVLRVDRALDELVTTTHAHAHAAGDPR
jgi:hypothetical protein